MKTFKLILLAAGFLVLSSGYGYTIFNIPKDMGTNALDNLKVSTTQFLELNIINSQNKGKSNLSDSNDDTLVINLAEVVITSEFPASAKECIMRQVPYPEFARKQKLEGGVALSFWFDRNGAVIIHDVYSSDPELASYVSDCVKNMQLDYCWVDIEREYYLRFLFKLK
ncbi:MAG: hypothetical protein K9H58_19035 [Bacteroidales bacterium]|nr:hypothetical protein [Bacteroidales bacterium]